MLARGLRVELVRLVLKVVLCQKSVPGVDMRQVLMNHLMLNLINQDFKKSNYCYKFK